jgi:hypothetical protein
MNIESIRKEKYDDRTIGSLYVNGSFECFTLEDKDRGLENGGVKIPAQTAIPRGKYQVIIDWSDRHRCLMLHILDVPHFTGIRFDIANDPSEIKGCIAVGKEINWQSKRTVHSADALRDLSIKILNALLNGEQIWLEIT